MQISLITVVRNRADSIHRCLESVASQRCKDFEHVIIDGASTDGTAEIISQYSKTRQNVVYISEPDEGIYDAINKGLQIAQGEIVGFLHSDDVFGAPDALASVGKFLKNSEFDGCFGQCKYFINGDYDNCIREYKLHMPWEKYLKFGIIPPHSTLFLKQKKYKELGSYNRSYKIGGDFEFFCKMATNKVNLGYCSDLSVNMDYGGVSTMGSSFSVINKEIHRALNENNLMVSKYLIYLRYFKKIIELKPINITKKNMAKCM